MDDPNVEKNEEVVEYIPRDYQVKLIKIGVKQNSIMFLPTGSGKTFIAVNILKELASTAFKSTYSQGGKISVFLVNTVALVNQHTKYLQKITPYDVGMYTGDMNVDFWDEKTWLQEYDKNQVLVMTAQIFANSINWNMIDLNKVNLIIFDECHQAVDAHAMRLVMRSFQTVISKPHVLGLTATLLNGNVKPSKVLDEIINLETTFHAKVATIDELGDVWGYSTNPTEHISIYQSYNLLDVESKAIIEINRLLRILNAIKIDPVKPKSINLPFLDNKKSTNSYSRLLQDAEYHIKMFGIAGGLISIISYMISLEYDRINCIDKNMILIINVISTKFTEIRKAFEKEFQSVPENIRMAKYSSPKVLKVIEILRSYEYNSKEELCGIIFVKRKNTAIFLYHILLKFTETMKNLQFLRPDFVIGFHANPLNMTRGSMYYSKMKKDVIDKFNNKEINVLIASNVIEEGVDITTCSLVIKFDTPTNYREYIQSKGRARHASSLYYIMVEQPEQYKFAESYASYHKTEENMNNYLIGKNDLRSGPDDERIKDLYDYPVYYVNGPDSAQVTIYNAIPLLSVYCQSLSTDSYTNYEPDWYLETIDKGDNKLFKVHVELPIVCPLPVLQLSGIASPTKRDAKRSTAFNACILLHKSGELDDYLRPARILKEDEFVAYLFTHWPEIKEKTAGTTKMRRVHEKKIPRNIQNKITSYEQLHLHFIDINADFVPDTIDIGKVTLFKMYENDLRFGFVTKEKLPPLCRFPIFVSAGGLTIDIRVNQRTVILDDDVLRDVRCFHHLVFNDVLGFVTKFLILGESGKNMLIVPVRKSTGQIDYDVLKEHKTLKNQYVEVPHDERIQMVVDEEGYLNKIVTPWYRREDIQYIVLRVCDNLSAESQFPNDVYSTYSSYFKDKYQVPIVNPTQPLLAVKAISSRLNCIKPRSVQAKRRRDDENDDLEIFLIPELCVKQEFPGSLWLQAKLLPTILHRTVQLLRAEELRSIIAVEAGLGVSEHTNWESLEVDMNLIHFKTDLAPKMNKVKKADDSDVNVVDINKLGVRNCNVELSKQMYDRQFPWKRSEEPKDIHRNLDVTLIELAYFVNFTNAPLNTKPETKVITPIARAINYNKEFLPKTINLLKRIRSDTGPELRDIYQSLMTAKCNDIVNLERLEMLGDSFLKFITTSFIFVKFPKYTEGQAATLKDRFISNKNLYYLAHKKGLPTYLKMTDLNPKTEWLPPGYNVPDLVKNYIDQKQFLISALHHVNIPVMEQIDGAITKDVKERVVEEFKRETDEGEDESGENSFSSMCSYINLHMVPDKTVADVTEALIGAYFINSGTEGALKFLNWLSFFPPSENVLELLTSPPLDPIVNKMATKENLEVLMPSYIANKIENIIGYKFKNRAYLLQAFTHSSYTTNRVTLSYERLEFIGDAILDFLITTFIYESNDSLSPGDLTNLRSALVNNEIFASYVVRMGLYKYLKYFNNLLYYHIKQFVEYQECRNFSITDDVLILLNEDDLKIAENVDVPKVLGDIFESVAGAIYLDSGKNLEIVWSVFYKIMWEEIDRFSNNIPRNPISMLYEKLGSVRPNFHDPIEVEGGNVMMKLDFMLNGSLTRVHGFGDNKKNAKKASAKIALKMLQS